MVFGFGSAEPTEEEKQAAVKTLLERLNDGTQPVAEQLKEGGEGELDEVTLHRWLKAENYDVDQAEKRLRAHAIWRKEKFPEGRVLESEIKDELDSGKCFMQGHDKKGRTITVLQVKKHSRSLRDLKQCMRLLCYNLDKAIASADRSKNPGGYMSGIFDLRGITMDSIDNSALRGVFDMLQSHYPERLGTLFMYESPSIFWVLWKAVSPFVDPVTRKKVIFVSGSTALDALTEEIDLEILPKEFGGKADLIPLQDAHSSLHKSNGHAKAANGSAAATAANGSSAATAAPVSDVAAQNAAQGTTNGAVMGP